MEYEKLLENYHKVQKENKQLQSEIENLKLQINYFKKYIFGSKKESTPKKENLVVGTQSSLFGESKDEEISKQIKEQTKTITVTKKSKKVKSGIKKSALKDIQKVTEEYLLEEENTKCPVCNSDLKQIGKEVVRQEVEYIPAKLKLVNYVRYIYKCEKCGTNESEKETPTIVKTKTPNPLLSHSFISTSLATEVLYQKYFMGVPLYRQEKIWDDRGLVIPRNMMANWCIKLSEYYLSPLCSLMLEQLKHKNEILHCDETTIQCNKEADKKATTKSYMWVIASGELEKSKGVIFNYSKSRSAEFANKLLNQYNGILVTDGYAGYNDLDSKLIHAQCWAHARRYFYESIPLDNNNQMVISCDGYIGLQYIDKLFNIEQNIDNTNINEILKIRQEKSEPILQDFYKWVYLTSQKYITNDKLKKALTYVVNQKENLSKFLTNGKIPLTNSRAERAIRPFAVHRKNWLFADSVDGAIANANIYSIIESAKINNLNIYKYVKYLLDTLPQLENEQNEEDLEKYLPWSKELPQDILNFQSAEESDKATI